MTVPVHTDDLLAPDALRFRKATVKLLLRHAHALGDRFEKQLGNLRALHRRHRKLRRRRPTARAGGFASAPMVAYTLVALVGQLAHRRLSTDHDITAAQVVDFVVALVLDGLRPRAPDRPLKGTGKLKHNHRLYCARAHLPRSSALKLTTTCASA
jgi:hypothetical protein